MFNNQIYIMWVYRLKAFGMVSAVLVYACFIIGLIAAPALFLVYNVVQHFIKHKT